MIAVPDMLPPSSGKAAKSKAAGLRSISAASPFHVPRRPPHNLGSLSLAIQPVYISKGLPGPTPSLAGHQGRFGAQLSRGRTVKASALAAAATVAPLTTANPWHTLAVLSTCAAASQLLESHTRWGAVVSAPLLALSAALAAAAVGLLPAFSPVYDAVWQYLMPLAVALYLLDLDIGSFARSGGQVLSSFLLGAITMFFGALCAWKLLGTAALGPHGAQLTCCLLASYIGGSVNFAAVAAATELPKALMPAAIAADNLAMLVLLGAMMAAPSRITTALTARKAAAAVATAGESAGALQSSTGSISGSSDSSHKLASGIPASENSLPQQSRPAGTALGLDGRPLLTELPTAAAVEACMQASAQGRAAVSSSSSYRSSASYKQHALSHRAVGHHASDSGRLRTIDPAAPSSEGGGTSNEASNLGNSTRSRSSACAGCRGSGVTALDDNPLLTQAPAMGDAISTIDAARQGRQRLRTGRPPGSSSSSSSGGEDVEHGSEYESAGNGVVGCGCCEEALTSMAAAGNSRSPWSSSSSSQKSGALGRDGGLLMTEDPGEGHLAAATAAAKAGKKSKSANVSVSGSALSTLASTDSEDLELVVRFNWKEFQAKLKKEEQQQQQKHQQQSLLPGDWEKISLSSSIESSDDEGLVLPGKQAAQPAAAVRDSQGYCSPAGSSSGVLTSSSGAAALAAATVACGAGQAAAGWLGMPALQLLLLSCCALGLSVAGNTLAAAVSKQQQQGNAATATVGGPFAGASSLGQLLMGLFFATLGASCCCSSSSFIAAAPQAAFVIIMVAVHWSMLAGLGRVLGPRGLNILPLSGEVLLVGSAANVGGPATAAALAATKGWHGLVQPALLCGSLGYALGTAGGMLLARGLGVLPG